MAEDIARDIANIRARVTEHSVAGPEVYAVHPADVQAVIDQLDLSAALGGGYRRYHPTCGHVGPRFCPDIDVPRGKIAAWRSGSQYRVDYERRMKSRTSEN